MSTNKKSKKLSENLEGALQALIVLKRTKFSFPKIDNLGKAEILLIMQLSHTSFQNAPMPSQIAEKLGISLAAVTHHLNSLEKQGYISRKTSIEDRRAVYVNLSKKGEIFSKKIKKIHSKKINDLVKYLGEQDTNDLIKLISKISEYIKNIE